MSTYDYISQAKLKSVQQANDRMEMELMYSRAGASELNGAEGSGDHDGDDSNGSIWRQKYERAMKELEYTKKLLQTQHEEDLEQMMAIKKQLEKKVISVHAKRLCMLLLFGPFFRRIK